jgi:uncharacterized protein YecE (DUF72 family)
MTLRIGTSGWAYSHWRGLFYPPKLPRQEWFRFYAGRFATVEINSSFYRLPSETAFLNWQEQAPAGFLYAVKASRYITHLKKLKDPAHPLETFFAHAAHLGDALGPVLYQLPPHWRVNLPRLADFLALLPKDSRHVIEFRDPSWLIDEAFQLMERYRVSHCLHDMAPLEVPCRVTADPVYVRLHGDPAHGGDYQPATLDIWARRIDDWQHQGLDVFIYFNNDINGYALANATMLKNLLSGK